MYVELSETLMFHFTELITLTTTLLLLLLSAFCLITFLCAMLCYRGMCYDFVVCVSVSLSIAS